MPNHRPQRGRPGETAIPVRNAGQRRYDPGREIEFLSRDRQGFYTGGARHGAPQAQRVGRSFSLFPQSSIRAPRLSKSWHAIVISYPCPGTSAPARRLWKAVRPLSRDGVSASGQIQGRPLGLALCFCIHADESVEVEGQEDQEQIIAAKIRKIGGKKRSVAALHERSPQLVESADFRFPPMGPCCEIQFISQASVSTSTSLCKEAHFLRQIHGPVTSCPGCRSKVGSAARHSHPREAT
jgi:hypothetical protein